MANPIYFLVVWNISPGNETAFKRFAEQAIERVKANEPGALEYSWHFSGDMRTCYILESYIDSAAVLLHLEDVASIVEQLSQYATTSRFEVFGDVSSDAGAALTKIGATICGRWKGLKG